MNNFGHVSIVFEYDMMCARVYCLKCFNFSNNRIRTDFYIKIRIRRMRIFINSVTSLAQAHCVCVRPIVKFLTVGSALLSLNC